MALRLSAGDMGVTAPGATIRHLPQGPMHHTPHPAIQRGRYEVERFCAGRVNPSGHRRIIQPVLIVIRIVEFDSDMEVFLERAVPPGQEPPDGFDSDELVQLVAPLLRDGLLDPGDGQTEEGMPRVLMMMRDNALQFVQMVTCLN